MRSGKIVFTAFVMLCICACSLPMPGFLKKEKNPMTEAVPPPVHLIAVLPVQSNTSDGEAVKILRAKLREELHFKGYPAIDSQLLDQKLRQLSGDKIIKKSDVIPPSMVEELMGADGVLYCSYEQENTTKLFYAPVTVSLRCSLRNAKTGETVWGAQSRSTSRSFDLFTSRLKMKSRGGLEDAMEEAVGEVMETLPYGPKLRG